MGFYVPLTARSYGDVDLGLKSHMKGLRSGPRWLRWMWSNWRPGGRGFNPRRGRQHSFVEIDHEIFSTVILSLPLIQEGQLSVSGEKNAQYWLTA